MNSKMSVENESILKDNKKEGKNNQRIEIIWIKISLLLLLGAL